MAPRAQPAVAPATLDETEFVVVDVETTGGSAVYDRVIEVAAVRVRAGRPVERFHTLVNPGIAVPPFITGLTGIATATVLDAPRFEAIAPALHAFLGETPFVAHNVAFDANFLRQEFARAGFAYEPTRVCTLRLARRLMPGLPGHGLDHLIQHLRLGGRHHRALPDAENTVRVFEHLLALAAAGDITTLDALIALQRGDIRRRPTAPQFGRELLSSLPTGPGVYLLKDAEGHIFYVGKSTSVRRRVREHLNGKYEGQTRLRKLVKRIGEVQVYPTGSELEALLLEAKLIRRYLPAANQQMRNWEHYPFIKVTVQEVWPRILPTRTLAADGALYFGPFRRAGTVASVVGFLRERFGLRECNRDRFPGGGTCPLSEFNTCLAPCLDRVDHATYRTAVDELIGLLNGEGDSLVAALEAHMHALAEQLRFEAAAELRDHLSELKSVVGTQRRLTEVSRNHALILAPAERPAERQLFCIREGRLIHQQAIALTTPAADLDRIVATAYAGDGPGAITKEAVDDMWIIAAWLRHHRDEPGYVVVDLDPADTAPALAAVRQALLDASQAAPPTPAHRPRQSRKAAAAAASGVG